MSEVAGESRRSAFESGNPPIPRDRPTLDKLLEAKGKIEAMFGSKRGIAADVHVVGDEKMTYAQVADFDL